MYMSSFFALTYGVMFAGVTSIITHTILYHGKDIISQYKRSRTEDMDIHGKLMRVYPEVPQWWYVTVFFCFLWCLVCCDLLLAYATAMVGHPRYSHPCHFRLAYR